MRWSWRRRDGVSKPDGPGRLSEEQKVSHYRLHLDVFCVKEETREDVKWKRLAAFKFVISHSAFRVRHGPNQIPRGAR